jgi:DNA polymerase
MMDRTRQLRVLEALGIDVYVRRDLGPAAPDAAMERSTLALRLPANAERFPRAPSPPCAMRPESALDWDELRAAVAACTRCELHAGRTQTVFGVGARDARWMIIGEAPGAEEDRKGEPFVGRAGQLLTSMLRALGLAREQVYIANILKCRPPGNRDPRPDEARSCRGYLERQIELISPTLILAVGRIAAQTLLGTELALGRLRGQVHALGERRWPVIVTYHPAYLLRSPGEKRKAWEDLLYARRIMDELESRRSES